MTAKEGRPLAGAANVNGAADNGKIPGTADGIARQARPLRGGKPPLTVVSEPVQRVGQRAPDPAAGSSNAAVPDGSPAWTMAEVLRLHRDLGMHVFPVGPDKRPRGRWRNGGVDYVTNKPSDDDVRGWARQRPTGWCVLAGGPAALVVLDVEGAGMMDEGLKGDRIRQTLDKLPPSCKRASPSGGVHAWLRVTDGEAPTAAAGRLVTRIDDADASGRPSNTLLAEYRSHGQYAAILGPGRGPLQADFAPFTITPSELQAVFDDLRAVSDETSRVQRIRGRSTHDVHSGQVHERQGAASTAEPDTGAVLADALLNGDLAWADVLDDGWAQVGRSPDGWTVWRRPPYGNPPTSATSANGSELLGTPALTVHSTSVPWAEPQRAYSPAHALAASRFDGDFAAAMRAVESTARETVEAGIAPSSEHFMASWPLQVLERVHAARHNSAETWRDSRTVDTQRLPPQTDTALDSSRYFDPRDGLRVATLATDVHRRVGPFAAGPGDTLWLYQNGVYVDDGGHEVRRAVVRLCGQRHRASHLTNVEQVLKAAHCSVTLPTGVALPDDRFLNLPNGLLNWRTSTLRPHDPHVASVHRIPVAWNPAATCPATDQFLRDLFGEDPAVMTFVEEIVGAVLYSGHPFHQRTVMLLGGGNNGKGTFLTWLRALLGDDNVSEVKPQALDSNRFASAQLYGKPANLAGDVAPTAFTTADRFKEIVAGDVINAEHKYGQPFSYHPVATMVASFNEMPATADRSDGFFRRWLVLPFPHRFVDARQATGAEHERLRDPRAVNAVTTAKELEGFLLRAIAGLRRLSARGDFAPPPTVTTATDLFREHGDPVVAFLREKYVADRTGFVTRAALRNAYEMFCEENRVKAMSATRLHEHLPGAAAAALRAHVSDRKRTGIRGFTGMRDLEAD